MLNRHTYVMSIAGFDPSGGAGLLADIKAFEQHKVYGLAVNTANTIQTEDAFYSLEWTKQEEVLKTIDVLFDAYPISAVKTGIVPSFKALCEIVAHVRSKNRQVKIVVDPVLRSSTGFDFHDSASKKDLASVLEQIDLLTPNTSEAMALTGNLHLETAALQLAGHCNVLLKGGHSSDQLGVDYLYAKSGMVILPPARTDVHAKHGSGCVLSAAITANLALGLDLEKACRKAKHYVERYLSSHPSLLGSHHV